jgi:hypothetical protein
LWRYWVKSRLRLCSASSNQFVMKNINQKIVFKNKDPIPWFNWDWR